MIPLLVAVLLWGVSNFFFKIAVGRLPAIAVLGWEMIAVVGTVSAVLYWERTGLDFSDRAGMIWALLGGSTVVLGGYFFLKALGSTKLAIAMPFSALNVLVSALLGILILGERLSLVHTIGALGMVISAILLSLPEGK